MTIDDRIHPSRRDALRATGSALAVAALSACSAGGSGPGPTTPATSSPSPSAPDGPPPWDQLATALSNGLLLPGQAGFAPDDLLYNPRLLGSSPVPQAVAVCTTAQDVLECVRFSASEGVDLRLRNGGHSYSGASRGPGLVADLSGMTEFSLDEASGTARVGAGSLLADVYQAVGRAGVAIGAGSCPTVGVSGLTLGGGVGVLTPSLGLTCDQVVAADVVTADGTALTVDADSHPDLFWALRGGGAGLAAVTAWTFRVVPAPDVTTFSVRWDVSAALDVLAAWQEWTAQAPRELWSTCKLLVDPAAGARAQVSGTWTGSGPVGPVLDGLLAALPAPAGDSRRDRDYLAAMLFEAGCSGLDAASCVAQALAPDHRQPFSATSSILAEPLPEEGVRAAVEQLDRITAAPPAGLVEAGFSFDALGGAVADVDPAGTAFPWRTALATVQHTATYAGTDGTPFDALVTAGREALAPWAGTSAYVNYDDGTDTAQACWGPNAERLRSVKDSYDPAGLFGGNPTL